ncbi:MAG: hypothetical protein AAGA99_01650 [Actinomycetota bacterium]
MKILAGLLGGLVAIVGVGLLIGGVVIRTAVGSNGEIGSDVQLFGTPSRGFVTRTLDLGGVEDLPFLSLDELDLTLDVAASRAETFVGVGPASDVDAYLDGVDVERIRSFELDPFALDTERTGGDVVPAPPLSLDFWTTSVVVTGEPLALDIDLSQSNQRLVIMNADGSPDVSIEADVVVELPFLSTLAWILIVVGLLLLVAGIAIIVSAVRSASNSRWLPPEGQLGQQQTWSQERWDAYRESAAAGSDRPTADPSKLAPPPPDADDPGRPST